MDGLIADGEIKYGALSCTNQLTEQELKVNKAVGHVTHAPSW